MKQNKNHMQLKHLLALSKHLMDQLSRSGDEIIWSSVKELPIGCLKGHLKKISMILSNLCVAKISLKLSS